MFNHINKENHIDKIFDLLDDWRRLPAYQLERRADIFFGLYLEDILKEIEKTPIDLIIPEFPLRLGELPNKDPKSNLSFKIDYIAYSKSKALVYFVELKTDVRSRRTKQDEYYQGAQKIGLNTIIEGVIKIYYASKQKVKYDFLIDKLVNAKWIKRDGVKLINTTPKLSLKVVYIQPTRKDKKMNLGISIIYDDIINVLSGTNNTLIIRFIESLKQWKTNPGKKF